MSEYVKPNHRTLILEPDHTVCDATDKVRLQSSQMKFSLMYHTYQIPSNSLSSLICSFVFISWKSLIHERFKNVAVNLRYFLIMIIYRPWIIP